MEGAVMVVGRGGGGTLAIPTASRCARQAGGGGTKQPPHRITGRASRRLPPSFCAGSRPLAGTNPRPHASKLPCCAELVCFLCLRSFGHPLSLHFPTRRRGGRSRLRLKRSIAATRPPMPPHSTKPLP